MPELNLDRPRDLSAIVSTAFQTWWHHLGVFIALAAIPVFPAVFLTSGLWAGHLEDPDRMDYAAVLGGGAVQGVVITPLVTAMHVLVVLGLARGEHPSVGDALRDGLRVMPVVLVAVLLYALAVIAGTIALIIPGIWLGIALYFTAQAAVVDGARGRAALRRSFELVRGSWWRTFGILLVLSLIAFALAVPLGFVTQMIGTAADNGPLYVLGEAVAQTVTLSFTALAGTILFFDLRTRKAVAPVAAPAPDHGLASPERPF
jgi:hypothetical protein